MSHLIFSLALVFFLPATYPITVHTKIDIKHHPKKFIVGVFKKA